MPYQYERTYRGPVKLVVFDLAGTIVDYGSCAPVGAFIELFHRHDIELNADQARGPMGMHKRDHIRALLELDEVRAGWRETKGNDWSEGDLDALYEEFVPIQLDVIRQTGDVIPGAGEMVAALREGGVKVAFTTGYNREMADLVGESLDAAGVVADAMLCVSDVPTGRPAPWLIYQAMQRLDVYPPAAVVKVGDTIADVESGLNAGVWSVGVAKTGNMVGLNSQEINEVPEAELCILLAKARDRLCRAGAHDVVDGVGDLEDALVEIHSRLARGEAPG